MTRYLQRSTSSKPDRTIARDNLELSVVYVARYPSQALKDITDFLDDNTEAKCITARRLGEHYVFGADYTDSTQRAKRITDDGEAFDWID